MFGTSKMHLSPSVVWAAVRSKAVVLLLLIHCLLLLSVIVCGGSVFVPCFVILFLMSFHFCNHLDGEERDGCFTLIPS